MAESKLRNLSVDFSDRDNAKEIYNECGTIRKMLISSINTVKSNSDKKPISVYI